MRSKDQKDYCSKNVALEGKDLMCCAIATPDAETAKRNYVNSDTTLDLSTSLKCPGLPS